MSRSGLLLSLIAWPKFDPDRDWSILLLSCQISTFCQISTWPWSTFAPSSHPYRSWTNHTSGKRSSLDMIPDLQLFPFLPEIKFAKVTQFHNEWRWPVFQWISAKILLQQSKAFPPIHFHLHKGTTVLGSSGENGTYWLFHAQLFHFHDDNHQSYPL